MSWFVFFKPGPEKPFLHILFKWVIVFVVFNWGSNGCWGIWDEGVVDGVGFGFMFEFGFWGVEDELFCKDWSFEIFDGLLFIIFMDSLLVFWFVFEFELLLFIFDVLLFWLIDCFGLN